MPVAPDQVAKSDADIIAQMEHDLLVPGAAGAGDTNMTKNDVVEQLTPEMPSKSIARDSLEYLVKGAEYVSIKEIIPSVVMHTETDRREHHQERLIFSIRLNREINPAEGEKLIQESLGHIPLFADVFNKLQAEIPVKDQIEALTREFSASEQQPAGFSQEEINMLGKWEEVNQAKKHQEIGPELVRDTDKPLTLSYRFKKSAGDEVDKINVVKDNLQERSEAIRTAIIENASNVIMASGAPDANAMLAEIRNLRVNIKTSQHDSDEKLDFEIGISGHTAPDEKLRLVQSKALDTLMSLYPDGFPNISVGEEIARQSATFAGDGWNHAFPLIASGSDVNQYLSKRAEDINNPDLASKVAAMFEKEQKAVGSADFRISVPGTHGSEDYSLVLSLPEDMHAAHVYNAIIDAANEKQQQQKDVPMQYDQKEQIQDTQQGTSAMPPAETSAQPSTIVNDPSARSLVSERSI